MLRGPRHSGRLAVALSAVIVAFLAPNLPPVAAAEETGPTTPVKLPVQPGTDNTVDLVRRQTPADIDITEPGGGALDVVGIIPIAGAIPDLVNAGIYAAEGDYGMAALSATAAVPIVGDAVGVGKLALKYGDNVIGAVAHYGDDAIEVAGAAMRRVDDDFVDFAHGTTRSRADKIMENGVSEDAIRANSKSGSSEFYTVKVDRADPNAAFETAAAWAKTRHGGDVCVVVCRIPKATATRLERSGDLFHTREPVQSVFRPRSFETLNSYRQSWQRLDPPQ